MKTELPKRKSIRLKDHNYSESGAYFITVCVRDRRELLSIVPDCPNKRPHTDPVGTGIPDCPSVKLLKYGEIADRYIRQLNDFYDDISVDKYIIMPDHIHLLITVSNGQSRTPVPTGIDNRNSVIAKFISTFKRFCNKEYGENIWQARYYDHIIRNREDYNDRWQYIDNNTALWIIKKQGKQCEVDDADSRGRL